MYCVYIFLHLYHISEYDVDADDSDEWKYVMKKSGYS